MSAETDNLKAILREAFNDYFASDLSISLIKLIELQTGSGSSIDDDNVSTETTYSSSKIENLVIDGGIVIE